MNTSEFSYERRVRGASDESIFDVEYDGFDFLNLSGNVISVRGLERVASWPIRALSLAASDGIGKSALKVVASIPTLTWLDLTSCIRVDDTAVTQLRDASALRTLVLRWCWNISDLACETLGSLALRSLELEGCEDVTDAGVELILRNRELRSLGLPDFSHISDKSLHYIAASEVALETLEMAQIRLVTDKGLLTLATIASLKHLSLIGMQGVTDNGIASLRRERPDMFIEAR